MDRVFIMLIALFFLIRAISASFNDDNEEKEMKR